MANKKEKRYPRGILFPRGKAKQTTIELIELKEHGAFYCEAGEEDTVFMPYSSIEKIAYEAIPQELIDKAQKAKEDARPDTTETDSE